jgi:hypothetical protein
MQPEHGANRSLTFTVKSVIRGLYLHTFMPRYFGTRESLYEEPRNYVASCTLYIWIGG